MRPTTEHPRKGLQTEAEILDFAGRSVGPIEANEDISRLGSTHRVSLLHTRSGDVLVAKWFADSRSYYRSFDAFTHHTAALGTSAPRLIDHHDGLKAMLITRLPGERANREQSHDPVTHFHVGQLLRRFHESASATRSVDRGKDLAGELSRLVDLAEDDLGLVVSTELRALGMDVLDIGTLTLQPLHGSLTPEHWIVDSDYGTQLISFSASEYDPWIFDVAALERGYWTYSPELRSAFYSGYDRQPGDEDAVLLRAELAISALTQWVTSRDTAISKKARGALWSQVEQVTGGTLF